MKRRAMSLLLVFSMILTLLPLQAFAVDTANPFRDVSEGDWCYEAVQYVRVNGIFNGTTATTFDPNSTMTRGMFVAVLGRMAGVDTENYQGRSSFSDVPESAYYAPYVAWASKYGRAQYIRPIRVDQGRLCGKIVTLQGESSAHRLCCRA